MLPQRLPYLSGRSLHPADRGSARSETARATHSPPQSALIANVRGTQWGVIIDPVEVRSVPFLYQLQFQGPRCLALPHLLDQLGNQSCAAAFGNPGGIPPDPGLVFSVPDRNQRSAVRALVRDTACSRSD
jgi:hypothetical protein